MSPTCEHVDPDFRRGRMWIYNPEGEGSWRPSLETLYNVYACYGRVLCQGRCVTVTCSDAHVGGRNACLLQSKGRLRVSHSSVYRAFRVGFTTRCGCDSFCTPHFHTTGSIIDTLSGDFSRGLQRHAGRRAHDCCSAAGSCVDLAVTVVTSTQTSASYIFTSKINRWKALGECVEISCAIFS